MEIIKWESPNGKILPAAELEKEILHEYSCVERIIYCQNRLIKETKFEDQVPSRTYHTLAEYVVIPAADELLKKYL